MKPFLLYKTNDALEMISKQCENCGRYQASRPMCKIIQDYFKGTYVGKVSPEKWIRRDDGEPECLCRQEPIQKEIPDICKTEEDKILEVPKYEKETKEQMRELEKIIIAQ